MVEKQLSKLKIQIFNNIKEIPREFWNSLLLNRSNTFSHEFWSMLEKSKLDDFHYHYILIFDENNTVVAQTSFYATSTDCAIFAPKKLRFFLEKVRTIFPGFLKFSILECGTPITINSPPFLSKIDFSMKELIDTLNELLIQIARKKKHLLILVRDFEENSEALKSQFAKLGYHWIKGLPNTYMNITWSSPDDYLLSMKSYYRSKLQNHLRKNQKRKIRHELVTEFQHLADTLHQQWLLVHHHADEFQREILTPDFYRSFSNQENLESKALLFYQEDELIGHALLLKDGDLLRWLYFGRKEDNKDSLYIYVCHKVIETAILLKVKTLEMGLTTYSMKQDLGAQVTPIHYALRSSLPFINPLIGYIYRLLNNTPKIKNKQIFKLKAD